MPHGQDFKTIRLWTESIALTSGTMFNINSMGVINNCFMHRI